MKTLKKLLYCSLICIAALFTSCSSDDNGGDNGDTGNNGAAEFLTAKIDGADFAASQDPAVLVGAQMAAQGGTTVVVVQGSDNNGNAINFSIFNYEGVGTYTTGDGPTNSNLIQYLTVSPFAAWGSNLATSLVGGLTPGEIIITSDDGTTIEGTFSFEGYNADNMTTKTITEGEFKANFDN